MATNWTMVDAFEVIKKNEDRAAVADIVKRFPLTSRAMILASTNEGAEEIVRGLPVYVTVRKIENVLKGEIEDDEVDATETEEETPKKRKPAKKSKKKHEPEDEDVDDDDDDEEEEEEASKKKPAKKGKKTTAKKSKKKPEPEEEDVDDDEDDDDDDWDI